MYNKQANKQMEKYDKIEGGLTYDFKEFKKKRKEITEKERNVK